MRCTCTTYLLTCFIMFSFVPLTTHADKVFYSPDGKTIHSKSDSSDSIKPLTFAEKLERDAEAAAKAGYKEGETVKIEDGIIYRLYKDPATGRHTFRLFKKVMKTASPADSGVNLDDADSDLSPVLPAAEPKPILDKTQPDKKENREFPPVPEEEKERKTHPPGKYKKGKQIFATLDSTWPLG